jgi:hypothetical protein
MSTIAAGTTSGTALVNTGDTTGALVLQTNGTTTAVTIATNQVVTLAQPLPVGSGGTGATSLSGITVGTATNATNAITSTNLAGGSNGTIPYQSASGTTQMLAVGSSGQVLQTNGAGAPSWITPSSGALVYVSQVVANNSSTVSFTGLTAYDNYMVIYSKVFPDTASTIVFTMLTSTNNGSSYATSSYKYSVIYGNGGSTGIGGRSSSENATYINLVGDNMNASVASSQTSGQIVLNLKNGTSYDFYAWGNFAETNDNPQFIGGVFSSNRAETSATNAIRFKFTSGGIVSGTFRLYGIANS